MTVDPVRPRLAGWVEPQTLAMYIVVNDLHLDGSRYM